MAWVVEFVEAFELEFDVLPASVQDELLAQAAVIEHFGPGAGRPRVDTLNGSRHANMKEMRFDADGGVWRVAFAFDPRRRAMLLVAGDKSGGSEKRFYARLIEKADERFDSHLKRIGSRRK
ncbi:MAG: type II toxin-antitoxin system RelE/ParE family toxin [Xanthomonadales bacterium]|nr:type II toxin-antitoxin system RelE/ParE family toxin [Xanthomonadales bacterium]MBK7144519.1 type II toxin-antitoxin system RelE/ParE family toxin [Xanthomonadales bacterium]MCC7250000.1 type II toxin-antitoxin system RelE/ParE family toxin [Lysobacter sp.]